MPYEIQKNKRSKGLVGFVTVGVLSLAAVTGTTYANLTTSTSTEADSEWVKSELAPNFRFNYFHADDSQLIQADVTPKEATTTLSFQKKITNDSSLPAQAVLFTEGFDMSTIPAAMLDGTTVKIKRSDISSATFEMTLREFAERGILVERTILADRSFVYSIDMVVPAASSRDYSAAFGNFEEKFNTKVVFSQVIGTNSPLVSHFSKTGNFVRNVSNNNYNAWLIDKSAIEGVVTSAQ